jgi:hypothetical protein
MTGDIKKAHMAGGILEFRKKCSSLFSLGGIESAEIEQWDGVCISKILHVQPQIELNRPIAE